MKEEIDLNINTDENRFENWLEAYQRRSLSPLIELGEGKYLGVIGGLSKETGYSRRIRHEIKAALLSPDPDKPDMEISSFEFPVIELQILETQEKRINVKMRCLDERLMPYFIQLLDEVAKLWPETSEEVTNYKVQMLRVGEPLFDSICNTAPENIYGLAHNFSLGFNQKIGLTGWIGVKRNFSAHTYQIVFNVSRFSSFGMIGHVDILPINDISAQVRVIPYGMLPKFIDGREEIYEAGLAFLNAFAELLRKVYEHASSETGPPERDLREDFVERAAPTDAIRNGRLGEGIEQVNKAIPPQVKSVKRLAPNRQADYYKWKLVWKNIKEWVEKGASIGEIHKGLERKSKDPFYKGPVYSKDTLRKIIRAGRAGELETS
jgi:hypothetical protein